VLQNVCCFSTEASATRLLIEVEQQQRDNAASTDLVWAVVPLRFQLRLYKTEIASRLVDRLDDVMDERRFPLALCRCYGAGYTFTLQQG
jgi:hypothetical protein